eukprot:UN06194
MEASSTGGHLNEEEFKFRQDFKSFTSTCGQCETSYNHLGSVYLSLSRRRVGLSTLLFKDGERCVILFSNTGKSVLNNVDL